MGIVLLGNLEIGLPGHLELGPLARHPWKETLEYFGFWKFVSVKTLKNASPENLDAPPIFFILGSLRIIENQEISSNLLWNLF